MNTTSARPPEPERILQRLEWTVIRRLDGLLQGDYRTLFHGAGLDFNDLRPYQFADDVRTIDWNTTARLREPHIKRYNEDRQLDAWFLVDTSPSLDFGTKRPKRELVVDLVGTLAATLARHGNRVGACLFDGSLPRLFPAATGRKSVLTILRALLEPNHETTAETDLSVLLNAMAGVLARRALVFVISDFYSTPGWQVPLGMMAHRHEVLAVRIHDPSENQLPDLGAVWFEDAETGGQLLVDTRDRGFQRRLAQVYGERDKTIEVLFKRAGVDVQTLSTADDFVRSLLGWAERRKFRKSQGGS